jgi:hypothetical protein
MSHMVEGQTGREYSLRPLWVLHNMAAVHF